MTLRVHVYPIRTLAVEVDRSLDFLKLVLDERILLVAVCVVVGERVQRLAVLALADEVTGRLGHEPDEEELEDGGDCLEERGNTP